MTADTDRAGSDRPRRWTQTQKLQIVQQSLAAGASIAEVAQLHKVSRGQIYAWRNQLKMGKPSAEPDNQARFALVAVANANGVVSPIESNQCTGAMVEVLLRNGRVMRLSHSVMVGHAAQLADALEGCRP